MKPQYIIIHHSWTEDGISLDTPAIKRYHTKTLGWSDIGYHYLLEKYFGEWQILKGRMDTDIGAHTKGFNDKSIGICLVGNFDSHPPDNAALTLLARLVRSLQEIHDIPIKNVIGHRESYTLLGQPVIKTCPGEKFDMDKFRALL